MPGTRPLPSEAEAELDKHSDLGRRASEQGDFDTAEQHLLAAWECIPEPKLEHEHADVIAVGITQLYRDTDRAEEAQPWLALAREAHGSNPDPQTEFLAATVHYAAGEFDEAYALFDDLYHQYGRRPFENEDPAYLEFYLEGAADGDAGPESIDPRLGVKASDHEADEGDGTDEIEDGDEEKEDDDELEDDEAEEAEPAELPDDIYEQIEALSEEGNDLSDDEDPAGAEAVWRQAIDLLPEPRVDWEAYTWLSASIGEACYQQGNYEDAKDSLFDALNGPGGPDNPFVHYMLGKSLLKLDEQERGVDELMRAYMLDGVDIFDSDEAEGAEILQVLQERGLVDE